LFHLEKDTMMFVYYSYGGLGFCLDLLPLYLGLLHCCIVGYLALDGTIEDDKYSKVLATFPAMGPVILCTTNMLVSLSLFLCLRYGYF
jgi:hypothetical protein